MKSLLLILLVSLGGSQASFSSSSRMNGRLTRSKLIKRPPIVFNVTSQTVFIDGCWATFTCTVTFDWTPQTGPTNIQLSNANIDWNCPTIQTYYIRGVSVASEIDGLTRTIHALSFASESDTRSNKLIELEEFNRDVIDKINDQLAAYSL